MPATVNRAMTSTSIVNADEITATSGKVRRALKFHDFKLSFIVVLK